MNTIAKNRNKRLILGPELAESVPFGSVPSELLWRLSRSCRSWDQSEELNIIFSKIFTLITTEITVFDMSGVAYDWISWWKGRNRLNASTLKIIFDLIFVKHLINDLMIEIQIRIQIEIPFNCLHFIWNLHFFLSLWRRFQCFKSIQMWTDCQLMTTSFLLLKLLNITLFMDSSLRSHNIKIKRKQKSNKIIYLSQWRSSFSLIAIVVQFLYRTTHQMSRDY